MTDSSNTRDLLAWTVAIVSAHVSTNAVAIPELAELIRTVHGALAALAGRPGAEPPLQPAVAVRKSITPDYIICLEDGRRLKMLKRHLKTAFDMTPEQYRERWGLAADYPMVAPNYARQRSSLAKKIGLGRRRRRV
jgi:predicted transcriptional regulator